MDLHVIRMLATDSRCQRPNVSSFGDLGALQAASAEVSEVRKS